jgi:7-cyano-7-deazaguanine synthase
MKAILIYSGGLDSTTLLYEYRESIALAVSFDYGSKHNAREIAFAREHCRKLGIPHLTIPLEFIGQYFRSDLLLSGGEIPEGHYADENMKSTVVPFRNGIMLAIAAGLAESRDLDTVLLANHGGDHTIYPDCRPEFIDAFDRAAQAGTYNGVRIVSPYCNITKRDIALRGQALGIDYARTYSCYKGGEKHCGRCGTCTERKEALEGFDPTEYEA